MAYLTHQQTLFSGALPNFSALARLEIDPTNGDILIHDPVSQTLARADLGTGQISAGDFRTTDLGNARVAFDFKGTIRSIDQSSLDRLIDAQQAGSASGAGQAYLDGPAFYGNLATLSAARIGGQDFVYLARKAGFGLEAYRAEANGTLVPLQILGDTANSHLREVTAMTTLSEGGQSWLVTASSSESGISVYDIDATGRLTHGTAFGFAEQLPVTTPTDMVSIDVAGRSYVLVTAHGTGSLTVLEFDAGDLVFRDQVNDSRDTRFDGATTLATFQRGDLTLVAVAGHDGGLSLMQLLPGGRLIHRETFVDGLDTALDGVTGLAFVEHGNGSVSLFALSQGDAGLSRFQVDAGALGITATGQNGTSGADVLTASDGGSLLLAGAGDDILLDGAGEDTLWGGDGADIFIFHPDGEEDRIGDFKRDEDRLDFSAFELVHDASAIGFRQTSGGAVLTIGDEELVIYTHNGRALRYDDIADSLMLAADHVLIPQALPQIGTNGNDMFVGTAQADTVMGEGGFDTLDYSLARTAVVIDLADNNGNDGDAAGDVLSGVEGLIGTPFNDLLMGTSGANNLMGGAGHDTILGGAGSDWITPGTGSNVVDGGAGRDMVSFVDLPDLAGRSNLDYRLDINLSIDRAISHDGSETHVLENIERVTGTIFADRIRGDGGDNELRGLGDYDWFIATWGSDTYDGGTGRDVISYVEASAGVTVDLAAGQGLRGMALGDTYTSIERATGSGHADLFYGDAGENDFRGLGGYDTFVGSTGGRERYDGGSGLDTVTYFQSDAGVTASLLLGYGSGGDAARDLYTSIENLGGTSFDDILTGDNGRNSLRGLAGDDLIFGNGGIDYITGGRGNDTIDGGSGSDYAVFDGARDEYAVTRLDSDRVAVAGRDGSDLLIDVEYFRFDDETLRIWDL